MEAEGFKWAQTVHSVEVFIPKQEGKSGKDYEIKFTPETILVKLKGQEKPILEGKLWQKVKVSECLWMIEEDENVYDGKPYIYIYLYKYVKREMGTSKSAAEVCRWRKDVVSSHSFLGLVEEFVG